MRPAAIPADEFAAKPDPLLRFAAEPARSQRGLRGWLERRAATLRIRLANDREGNLALPRKARCVRRRAHHRRRGAVQGTRPALRP